MLTVFGTIALDTTRTPFKTEIKIMGGAATFASLSSSFYTDTSIVGVIGSDFPSHYRKILDNRLDTKGIITDLQDKTFHYDSTFDYDLSHRTTNKTELNVIAHFEPTIPNEYRKSQYIYLANNDPIQNIKLLEFFPAAAYPMEEIVDPTGAGDAFAGGFIGYLAQQDNLKNRTFKEAVVHGNVMGAFAVEDFGVKRLLAITKEDIQKRFELYRKIVEF